MREGSPAMKAAARMVTMQTRPRLKPLIVGSIGREWGIL